MSEKFGIGTCVLLLFLGAVLAGRCSAAKSQAKFKPADPVPVSLRVNPAGD